MSEFDENPPSREAVTFPEYPEPKMVYEPKALPEPMWRPIEEEAMPAFMPPKLRIKLPDYHPPPALPFPHLINTDDFLLPDLPKKFVGFRPVFVIDVSGGMKGQKLADLRACMALLLHRKGAISSSMGGGGGFNMIAFEYGAERWMQQPVAPTEENFEKALQWLNRFPGKGCGNVHTALLEAYAQVNASAIFLLTDGKLDRKLDVVETIRQQSHRRIKIHSIGIGHECGSGPNSFLTRVVKESRGSFTPFTHDMTGVEGMQHLQKISLEGTRLKELPVSRVQHQCRSAHNKLVSKQIDLHNGKCLKQWEKANAAVRDAAWKRHQGLIRLAHMQHREGESAAYAVAKKQYRENCREVANRNEANWNHWKRHYQSQLQVYESSLHDKLSVQNQNKLRMRAHKEIVEEGYQNAIVQAQVKYETSTKNHYERKENWNNIQKQKIEKFNAAMSSNEKANREAIDNAKKKWEQQYAARNQAAYAAHAVGMTEWKEQADAIQAQNDAKMNQARLEHSDKVDDIRGNNEGMLSRAREEYEEEVAAVEYYNASVQPVVQKADRANVLITDIERFLELVFRNTKDFQGTVEIPLVIASLKSVFPSESSRLLLQAFEEHFTKEELRTRSFYPYYHHNHVKEFYT